LARTAFKVQQALARQRVTQPAQARRLVRLCLGCIAAPPML